MSGVSQVLARKYRPQVFNDLIGQQALVQTITNAIDNNRLAHAYMLTGIRGVGKTSSARIIAKGLNCIGVDGNGGMTPNPCGKCKHCVEIMNDSHIDVVEIDAASNTGVDNVREIIEAVKYNPVSARFKIYIIDEVHMLSKQAFNALLKTLEEPPQNVKFIFATTEIRKVPITILSRCQRFDLKRLDETVLATYLGEIAQKESAQIDEKSLQLIARLGDGSCRDSLSLLDQALTQFNSNITFEPLCAMLGIVDKAGLFDLYQPLMAGDVPTALKFLTVQYDNGADPVTIIQDLLSLTHWLTRLKIMPDLASDITISATQRERGGDIAKKISMAFLSSAWQLLSKGLIEVKQSSNQYIALEMVLIRLAFLSELPTLSQTIEDLKKKPIISAPATPATHAPVQVAQPVQPTQPAQPATSAQTPQQPSIALNQLSDIVKLARTSGQRLLAFNIETYVRLTSIENNIITCDFAEDVPATFSRDFVQFLTQKTGVNWQIKRQSGTKTQTLKEKVAEEKALLLDQLKQTPVIAHILTSFPNTKTIKVTKTTVDEDVETDDNAIDTIDG